MDETLRSLHAGMTIPYGGDRQTTVSADLAAAFRPGDRIVVVQDTGAILHIPQAEYEKAATAVDRAHRAFGEMGLVDSSQLDAFYDAFADRLADDGIFEAIHEANRQDVERASERGRSTTRLMLTPTMRSDMIDGLRGWAQTPDLRGQTIETVQHDGLRVEVIRSGLGVVGFVFEGRPNVFADATGVLRSGNTVVFRIGSDALGTARAIVAAALEPALSDAGLPAGAVSLVDAASHAAGWAMFSDERLALAVARGSGPAVAQLGAVARQAGTPVSLHGTGGAWMVTGQAADEDAVGDVVRNSLDRKVCNTLNTCAVLRGHAERIVPAVLGGLEAAARKRGVDPKLHVVDDASELVPEAWWAEGRIGRAGGTATEPMTERIDRDLVGMEWEWEDSPEMTLLLVDSVDEAIDLFNRHSPRFAASLISDDPEEQERFFARIDAPFVGNGFTRWVDGQYALGRPELGLSNWQFGRLFGRGGVLSGDSVYTLRTRAVQQRPDVKR